MVATTEKIGTVRFRGTVIAQSPITIHGEQPSKKKDNGSGVHPPASIVKMKVVQYGKALANQQAENLTTTDDPADNVENAESGEKRVVYDGVLIPFAPSGGVRSKFRASLSTVLMDALRETGNSFDFWSLYTLLSGATFKSSDTVIGKGDHEKIDEMRQKNIVLDLFGAALGSIAVPGRLSVDHLIPKCKETKDMLDLPDDINQLPSGWALKGIGILTSKDNFIEERTKGITALTDEGVLDYSLYCKLAADDDSKLTNMKQFQRFEYIAPGTQFHSSFTIHNASALDISAMLFALQKFAQFPRIGGLVNRGCGKVKFEYDIEVFEDGEWTNKGHVQCDGVSGQLTPTGVSMGITTAFKDYLRDIQPQDLVVPARFFGDSLKEEDAKVNKLKEEKADKEVGKKEDSLPKKQSAKAKKVRK
jgi:hypothetical protein